VSTHASIVGHDLRVCSASCLVLFQLVALALTGVACGEPAEMSFVQLLPGTFEMGCTEEQSRCHDDEFPVHDVTLTRGFWLATTEVTQGQWTDLMGDNPSKFSLCGVNCPVEMVSWWEALLLANALSETEGLPACYSIEGCDASRAQDSDFFWECDEVVVNSADGDVYDCPGYRLPTEAEWEYAARADQGTRYSGSDDIRDVAWYAGNSATRPNAFPDGTESRPREVASLDSNAWGLFDMSGNVQEWTQDYISDAYPGALPLTDPGGSESSPIRVCRGGHFASPARITRVAARVDNHPGNRSPGTGVRLARTAER